MNLTYGGGTPKKITYNGTEVKKITYNGTVVWTAGHPAPTIYTIPASYDPATGHSYFFPLSSNYKDEYSSKTLIATTKSWLSDMPTGSVKFTDGYLDSKNTILHGDDFPKTGNNDFVVAFQFKFVAVGNGDWRRWITFGTHSSITIDSTDDTDLKLEYGAGLDDGYYSLIMNSDIGSNGDNLNKVLFMDNKYKWHDIIIQRKGNMIYLVADGVRFEKDITSYNFNITQTSISFGCSGHSYRHPFNLKNFYFWTAA